MEKMSRKAGGSRLRLRSLVHQGRVGQTVNGGEKDAAVMLLVGGGR